MGMRNNLKQCIGKASRLSGMLGVGHVPQYTAYLEEGCGGGGGVRGQECRALWCWVCDYYSSSYSTQDTRVNPECFLQNLARSPGPMKDGRVLQPGCAHQLPCWAIALASSSSSFCNSRSLVGGGGAVGF